MCSSDLGVLVLELLATTVPARLVHLAQPLWWGMVMLALVASLDPIASTGVAVAGAAAAIEQAWAEIRAIATDRPATADEVVNACATLSKGYPRGFETAGQVARSVAQLALHELPDTYFEEFVPKLSLVGADEVTEAARRYLDLEKMTTVVVGDVDKIQASLERLGLPVTMLST